MAWNYEQERPVGCTEHPVRGRLPRGVETSWKAPVPAGRSSKRRLLARDFDDDEAVARIALQRPRLEMDGRNPFSPSPLHTT